MGIYAMSLYSNMCVQKSVRLQSLTFTKVNGIWFPSHVRQVFSELTVFYD